MSVRLRALALTSLLALALPACQFLALERNLEDMALVGRIGGVVEREAPSDAAVFVVLCKDRLQLSAVLDYVVLPTAGPFEFFVEEGDFALAAYEDTNGNLRYDPGEPIAVLGSAAPLHVDASQTLADQILTLSSDLVVAVSDATDELSVTFPQLRSSARNVGVVADLDDERFDTDVGILSLWEPMRFVREYGLGVYLLEEYDPDKVPILFVHGSNGTPRSFAPLIDRLDRDRYQPFLFQYVTGASLELNTQYLQQAMTSLRVRFGFKRYGMVAYSMGGLVARRYIDLVGPDPSKYPAVFVAFSTPWGGHASAQLGVDYAPAVVPSWRDITPDSDFLADMHDTELPQSVHLYLLFSYGNDSSFIAGEDDGTVPLRSLLFPSAQRQATRVLGFDDDHATILKSDGPLDAALDALDTELLPTELRRPRSR